MSFVSTIQPVSYDNVDDIINSRNQTRLHVACEKGDLNEIDLLFSLDADVNVTDIYGQTPAHLASKCGSVDIYNYLHISCADYKAVDHYGFTPYDIALRYENYEVAENIFIHYH